MDFLSEIGRYSPEAVWMRQQKKGQKKYSCRFQLIVLIWVIQILCTHGYVLFMASYSKSVAKVKKRQAQKKVKSAGSDLETPQLTLLQCPKED